MADVGLDAAEMAYGRHVAGGKEGAQRLGLDAILDVVPATVCLDVPDQRRIEVCFLVCARERTPIGVGGGHGPLCRSPRGGAEAANHCVDSVSVALGVFQALQDQGCGSLADHRAVGVGVERTGAPAGRIVMDGVRCEYCTHVAGEVDGAHQAAV